MPGGGNRLDIAAEEKPKWPRCGASITLASMKGPTRPLRFHASKHVERKKRPTGVIVAVALTLLAAVVLAAVWFAFR